MIEIKKDSQGKQFNLYCNNELIHTATILDTPYRSNRNFEVTVQNNEESKKLLKQNLSLFKIIDKFTINGILEWLDERYFDSHIVLELYRTSSDIESDENLRLSFTFAIQQKFADWDLPFSGNSYVSMFVDVWEQKTSSYSKLESYSEPYDLSLMIGFSIPASEISITDEVNERGINIRDCHQETINLLINNSHNSFIASFNFPEELLVPCKQYLLYFAQFLKDLGINATSKLKEELGKVLFSVTPTDDVEALDKIQEALAIYLNLPSSQIVYDDSFAAMRLQQEIEKLQYSQRMAEREIRLGERELRLAQTVIENQDKIILQKDSIIDQQNKIIEKITSKSIIMDSAENKEELESIYDGLEAGHSKWLFELTGIKANLIKVIKTSVKNTFGKDENKSILGLNDEE